MDNGVGVEALEVLDNDWEDFDSETALPVVPIRDYKAEYQKRLNLHPDTDLTGKQEMFCQIYCANNFNARDAYLEAGYDSTQESISNAYTLLNQPHIRRRVQELMKPRLEKYEISKDIVLQAIAAKAFKSKSEKIELDALKLLGSSLGLFSETRNLNVTTKPEDLSDDDLKKILSSMSEAEE